jgi:sugar phosphate isomerase/epimerase
MYLSLNSQLTTGRVPWPQFAELAAKVGFPGVDIMLRPAMQAGVETTRKLLHDLKLKPAAIDLPVDFRKDDATFGEGMQRLEEAGPFAAGIGCPRMVTYILSSSDQPKDELRRVYKQRFTAMANLLARSHVRLGLEFLGPLHIRKAQKHEFIWRMPEMLEFAKECGPNVGLLLDAWHWHHAGATVQDILDAGKDRIVHIHFDDAAKLPPEQVKDNERLFPGEGVINLQGFIGALKQIGYEDALSVEVFGHGLKNMPPEEGARRGFEFSREVLQRAGVPA